MLAGLVWIGRNARWLIALGPVIAILLSDLAALLRPALPFLVALTYGVALARVNMRSLLADTAQPRTLFGIVAALGALMIAMPIAIHLIGSSAGLNDAAVRALVYATLAPPIASAAAIAFLLQADAAFALRLSIMAAFASPLIGPAVAAYVLGDGLAIAPVTLALRLAAMIGGAVAIASVIRGVLGDARIKANHAAFDGASAIVMIVFAIPLFAGFAELVAADVGRALQVLGLAMAVNTGMQLAALAVLSRVMAPGLAISLALSAGSRNAGMYLASVPENPFFTLFVALYQIPIYLTALIMRRAATVLRLAD
ncbi:MAG: hypothetical protein AAFZ05_03765 [Pseudomonadota bacterium]